MKEPFWPRIVCTVCKLPQSSWEDEEIVTYLKESESGGKVSKCCCKQCSVKTSQKWLQEGWEKWRKDS